MGATMPRAQKQVQAAALNKQQHVLWDIPGGQVVDTIDRWDPKTEVFTQAILEIVATGATVVVRPGSGGRSVGIAIWEGDFRHPPKWLYLTEELDEYCESILQHAQLRRGQAAD